MGCLGEVLRSDDEASEDSDRRWGNADVLRRGDEVERDKFERDELERDEGKDCILNGSWGHRAEP